MKIIPMDEDEYRYLSHVFESYVRNGIPSTELGIAAATFQKIQQAPDVPIDTHLGNATLADIGPNGVTLEVPVERAVA